MMTRRPNRPFRKKPLVKWHSTLLTWGGVPQAVAQGVNSAIELLNTGERGATQALTVLPDNQVECRVNCIRGSLYWENDSPTIFHTIVWGFYIVPLNVNVFPAAIPNPSAIADASKSWLWIEATRLSPAVATRGSNSMTRHDINVRSKRRLKPGESLYFAFMDTADNGTDSSVVVGLNLRTLITRLD